MELMRVLVVEDNSVVADAVAEGLRDEGIAVDVAYVFRVALGEHVGVAVGGHDG
jgi:DNA-binding response OmpR family regulator